MGGEKVEDGWKGEEGGGGCSRLECRGRRRLMTMEWRRRRWTTMDGMEKKEVGEDRWNGEGS